MRNRLPRISSLALAAVLATLPALAPAKIVCWKDKSGKVVGCGDTVPPEYQDSATKELDKRGVTRRTTESADEEAKQRTQVQEAARRKAEAERQAAEQKRQDTALMATYSNEREIDTKRDRDLQVVDLQMTQLRVSLKNAQDRQKEARGRMDAAAKDKKPASAALKDEAGRTDKEVQRLEATLAAKEKEKEDIRARYAEYHKRFTELKGGASR